jgi:enoyl-CoA hydratase/carnithine racemase
MSTLHITTPVDGVLMIQIDAPPANALGHDIRSQLIDELDKIEADHEMRAVILTGTGKSFCAGDDLKEARNREAGSKSLGQFGKMLNKIESLRVPVIGAINGHAIGGGLELALCCDIRIASDNAWFLGAGVNVGLMASVYRLPRLIGIGPAKAMLLTGTKTDSEAALRYGLVTGVYEPEALMDEALKLASRLATRAPLSVEASKRMIGQAFDLNPEAADRAAGKELKVLSASEDHRTALKAFAEKQDPKFSRR